MVGFVVGACVVALVSGGAACLAAWAYWHGYDSGFEAGAGAERSDMCEKTLRDSGGRRS